MPMSSSGTCRLCWASVLSLPPEKPVQPETVSGEATALLDGQGRPVLKTEFVRVPREDPADSRFEPIKLPEHLARAVQRMRQRLEALADAMGQ